MLMQFHNAKGGRCFPSYEAIQEADISRHRARWRADQGLIDPRRLIFPDETWTKTNMTRLRGWAPKRTASSGLRPSIS